MQQPQARLTGLTLSTTRHDVLRAIIDSLAEQSAARLDLFRQVYPMKLSRKVTLTGSNLQMADILHRNWPGHWEFTPEPNAVLRGLATMLPRE